MRGEIVVLTGASGCLGHQTLRLLIGKDASVDEVRCLDLEEPCELMRRAIEEDLAEFKTRHGREKKLVWIRGDIRDVNVVERTLEGADCVIHCAAKVDIWTENDKQNLDELQAIHVHGTENLLKASIRFGVGKFIHVSSFEVYTSMNTIYYATESTLPETTSHLFGASATTKQEAENLVRRYSNNKLDRAPKGEKNNSLNAVIVRFPAIYGEFDRHFVSKILKFTKLLGGKLQRVDNIWIRNQPIYVGNAAWSLVKAKQRMDADVSISGEEFHITDETTIGDSFDFLEPYLECFGMRVTKNSYPFLFVWLLLSLIITARKLLSSLDVFGLFFRKRDRLQEALEKDGAQQTATADSIDANSKPKVWYQIITPQALAFMCVSCFLNRTKASLRLDYEPLFDPDESKNRSLHWYKNHLKL